MSDNNSNELLEVDNGITDAEHERLDKSTRELLLWQSSESYNSPSLKNLAFIVALIVRDSPNHLNALYKSPDAAQEFLTNNPLIESRLRTIISSDASFKGIRRLRVLQAPGSLPLEDKPGEIGFLSQAFYETEYRGTAGDLFLDYIQHNDELFKRLRYFDERYYAKILSIVQSPGTGKSRLVHELGKQGKAILFYMNFGTSGDAFPLKDQTPVRLLWPDKTDVERNAEKYENLDKHFHNKVLKFEAMCCAFYAAIFRSFASEVKKLRAKYANELNKIPKEWYETFFGRQAFASRQKLFADMEKHYWEALHAILCAPEAAGTKLEEKGVIGDSVMLQAYDEALSELELTLGNNVPLLIVFDEAAKLVESQQELEESEVKKSHILCRVISFFSHHRLARIWTVFISTNSRIGDFSRSPKTESTDQIRVGGNLIFRPFTEIGLHQFAKPLKAINLERVWEYENITGFGRPIWKAQGDAQNHILSEVIKLGKLKLVKGIFEGKDEQFLAILSQRFCLDLVFGHPLTVAFEEEAVAGYMRFLIKTSENRDILYSTNPMEPILSQAAAELLWDRTDHKTHFKDAISLLNTRISHGMINRGTPGELAARLLLLLAKDICAQELNPRENELRYCGSVKLIRWLKVLFGDDVFLRQVNGRNLEQRVHQLFGNTVINFSHWIGMSENIAKMRKGKVVEKVHPEWLERLFATTTAVQCHTLQPFIDNVIPAYDTVTKKASQVLNQTKDRDTPNKSDLNAIVSEKIGLPDASCVILMMDLGCSKSRVKVTLDDDVRGTPYLRIHAKGCSGET